MFCIQEEENLGAVVSFWPIHVRNLELDDDLVDSLDRHTKYYENVMASYGIDAIETENDHENQKNLQEEILTLNFHSVVFQVKKKKSISSG